MNDPSTTELVTKSRLLRDFRALGIEAGMTLLIHSSLGSLGWVCGGPQAVIEALQETVGNRGTLVMPTHATHLTDPAGWQNPPVPESWWETIRDEMPVFDPALTTTRGMGVIPEAFRKGRGVRRSSHPQLSFAAWGEHRDAIVAAHSLSNGFGEDTPLGRLYDIGAYVLLLGVGHDSNTSLHLAEYRWTGARDRRTKVGCPMRVDGQRRWIDYEDLDHDAEDFATIGEVFEQIHEIKKGTVGEAEARLFSQPEIVDFAQRWMDTHR